jgi:hypothetical protein
MNKDKDYIIRREGEAARQTGHLAIVAGTRNPYAVGSFPAFCWSAGYSQDVRSIDELLRDWRKPKR